MLEYADFSPHEKAGSYQFAAAKLHQQITGDKPWFLIDPEVPVLQSSFHCRWQYLSVHM